MTNPIIEVNGDHATGSWLLLEPCTFLQSNQPTWAQDATRSSTLGRRRVEIQATKTHILILETSEDGSKGVLSKTDRTLRFIKVTLQ